jgi:hypothetical protein
MNLYRYNDRKIRRILPNVQPKTYFPPQEKKSVSRVNILLKEYEKEETTQKE